MPDGSDLDTGNNTTERLYNTLDTSRREIRVLKILPSVSTATTSPSQAPIECVLEHIFLDDGPIFHVLSYTWWEILGTNFEEPGEPGSLISINPSLYLDGNKVEVTKNLWIALWHLKRIAQGYIACPESPNLKLEGWEWILESNTGHLSLETPIWIDALCINQTDGKERDQQFMLMGDIYKSAQYVHAWLGPPAENNDLAMKLMGDLKNRLHISVESSSLLGFSCEIPAGTQKSDNCDFGEGQDDTTKEETVCETFCRNQAELDSTKSTDIINSLDKDRNWCAHWLALFEIYDRSYWKRLWIVQDYLLGREIILHIGICAIDGLIFSKIQNEIYRYCDLHQYLQTIAVQNFLDLKRMDKLNSFLISRQKLVFNLQNPPAPLLDVLRRYRQQLCTDPRDMVYGLLGLWKTPEQSVFKTDYSLPVAEVFKITARYAIESSASLDILLHAAERDNCVCWAEKHRVEKLSIPSWVPDWRCSGTMNLSWETFDQAASDGRASDAHFSSDNNILCCRGITLGRIEARLHLSAGDSKWMESTRQRLLEFVIYVVEDAGLSSNLDAGNVQQVLKLIYQTLLYKLRSSLPGNLSEGQFVDLFVGPFNSVEDALSMFVDRTVVEFTLEQCFRGACLFTSRVVFPSEAQKIGILYPLEFGICYPNCKVGDAIAIIRGCRAPIVLRLDPSNPGRFKVLGHVYMPSFLHGEAMKGFEEREFELL